MSSYFNCRRQQNVVEHRVAVVQQADSTGRDRSQTHQDPNLHVSLSTSEVPGVIKSFHQGLKLQAFMSSTPILAVLEKLSGRLWEVLSLYTLGLYCIYSWHHRFLKTAICQTWLTFTTQVDELHSDPQGTATLQTLARLCLKPTVHSLVCRHL